MFVSISVALGPEPEFNIYKHSIYDQIQLSHIEVWQLKNLKNYKVPSIEAVAVLVKD